MPEQRRSAPQKVGGGPPQLRVALVSDWFLPRLGGIETHLAGLGEALMQAGAAPEILTTIPGPPASGSVPVRRLDAWLDPFFHLALSPTLRRDIRGAFEAGHYDLAHIHVSLVAPVARAAVLAARDLGLRCVVTFHSVLLNSTGVLRAADAVFGWSKGVSLTAVGQLVADQAARAFPHIPVGVLPNGIDPGFWSGAPERSRAGGEIICVSAMRLNWKKRPKVLLEAFDRAAAGAAAAGRRLRLRIAGAGGERARMEAVIARARFGADIELLGALSREDLRALYAGADLFVLASIEEAFGIAALEARAAGLPVVTMAASGAREFLVHGQNALLARTDGELAEHLRTLALDDDLRTRLAGRDPAIQRFAWPEVAAAHLDAYRAAGAA